MEHSRQPVHLANAHLFSHDFGDVLQKDAQPTVGGAGAGKGRRHGPQAEHFEKEHFSPQGLAFFSQNFAQPIAGGGAGDGKG